MCGPRPRSGCEERGASSHFGERIIAPGDNVYDWDHPQTNEERTHHTPPCPRGRVDRGGPGQDLALLLAGVLNELEGGVEGVADLRARRVRHLDLPALEVPPDVTRTRPLPLPRCKKIRWGILTWNHSVAPSMGWSTVCEHIASPLPVCQACEEIHPQQAKHKRSCTPSNAPSWVSLRALPLAPVPVAWLLHCPWKPFRASAEFPLPSPPLPLLRPSLAFAFC